MKSLLRPILAGGLAAGTALILNTGCVDNRASIYVAGVMVVQPPQCIVTADASAAQWLRGIVDISRRRTYESVLLIGNQLTPRGDKVQAKAEPMRILLTAAEVTLFDAAGEQLGCADNPDCGSFSIFGSGVVSVNRSEEPAFGLFQAQLLPPIVIDTILPDVQASGSVTIVASVKVRGETLGGKEVETGEFIFPIDVCYGCLVTYNNGPCCLLTPGEAVTASCLPGQDRAFDCRECATDTPDNICDRETPASVCPTEAPP
jgi:hypothetical protein